MPWDALLGIGTTALGGIINGLAPRANAGAAGTSAVNSLLDSGVVGRLNRDNIIGSDGSTGADVLKQNQWARSLADSTRDSRAVMLDQVSNNLWNQQEDSFRRATDVANQQNNQMSQLARTALANSGTSNPMAISGVMKNVANAQGINAQNLLNGYQNNLGATYQQQAGLAQAASGMDRAAQNAVFARNAVQASQGMAGNLASQTFSAGAGQATAQPRWTDGITYGLGSIGSNMISNSNKEREIERWAGVGGVRA
jgi:hypothetical protein